MQGILVFADATARDAAITSPEEGQFAFLKDTNVTTYYTGSAWANVDTTGMTNPRTTTGDVIYSSSGSTPDRLGIGTAGQVLQVNSGATAPEWATPAGPTFRAYRATTVQSPASGVATKVQFNAESWDTDNCFDPTTNYRFTPNKSGYYELNVGLDVATQSGYLMAAWIYKNGSIYQGCEYTTSPTNDYLKTFATQMFFNGTTDYAEVYVYLGAPTTRNLNFGTTGNTFSGVWIRS
jgi:hypothetical protein